MNIYDIAISFVPSLGVKGAAHLVECFGSTEAVYAATADELIHRAELNERPARAIASGAGMREAEREAEYCRRKGIAVVGISDENYPPLMRLTPDHPPVLYVRGNTEALGRQAIAFVGTRNMTAYGQGMCRSLIDGLARIVPDTVIVSGLAFGIDATAHRSALDAGMTTVAFLANALPQVTPPAHERLAAQIIDAGGAIISELSSQSPQNGRLYIPRNRLIAAMAAATIVVESPTAGGSLTTAAYADGYSRTVMAVPGRATDMRSSGTNALIRNRKASLVTSAEDIVAELMWDLGSAPASAPRERLPLTDDEQRLFDIFGNEPISAEALAEKSGLQSGELSLLLTNLELSGAIRRMPGKQYEKI